MFCTHLFFLAILGRIEKKAYDKSMRSSNHYWNWQDQTRITRQKQIEFLEWIKGFLPFDLGQAVVMR